MYTSLLSLRIPLMVVGIGFLLLFRFAPAPRTGRVVLVLAVDNVDLRVILPFFFSVIVSLLPLLRGTGTRAFDS